jgi:hypothetical protein
MSLLEITFPPDLRQFVERQARELKFDTSEDYVISILERALSENASYAGLDSAHDFMMNFVNREEEAVLRQKIVGGMNQSNFFDMRFS